MVDRYVGTKYKHIGADCKQDWRYKTEIFGQKALIFQKLYIELSVFLGSNDAVNKALRVGHDTAYKIDKKISYDLAVKILNLHKKTIIKKEVNNGKV
jgi:HKD family nuclease